MSLRTRTTLTAILLSAVALAGCADDAPLDAGPEPERDPYPLPPGKGGIYGLLVDDNYRPVQLQEQWADKEPGEFQDTGFVLIVETGDRIGSTENGEFRSPPLHPGTYTLRVAADEHEAKESRVNVVAGEWTEARLEARRLYNDGAYSLSYEQIIVGGCYASALFLLWDMSAVTGCGDLSEDGSETRLTHDFGAIQDTVRAVVTEFYAHQDGYYTLVMSGQDPEPADLTDVTYEGEYTCGICRFLRIQTHADDGDGGRYGRAIMYTGLSPVLEGSGGNDPREVEYVEQGEPGWCGVRTHTEEECREAGGWYYALDPSMQLSTWFIAQHASKQYVDPLMPQAIPGFCEDGCETFGLGVTLAQKAQFIQTIYLYELPEEGIEEQCVLCKEYTPPE